jgi:apolipoprotein D and lipocalin family protein
MKKTRMMWIVLILLLAALAILAMAQRDRPLRVVPNVDPTRYAGQWYEIARLPNRYQKRCAGEVIATYTPRPDGTITVFNRCRLENGSEISVTGVARVAGKDQPNSKLKVRFAPAWLSFIPQVWGDYQVIALSPNYEHAVVGDPSRTYLWILSRTPTLDEGVYRQLLEEAQAQDFDVNLLQKTRQSGP